MPLASLDRRQVFEHVALLSYGFSAGHSPQQRTSASAATPALMTRRLADKTVIVITHRLGSIRHADYIYSLDQG
jgi:hypothetical protein